MRRADSEALFERALRSIPGGVNSPVRAFRSVGGRPFFACRAEGCHIWDVDGNRYVDYVGTWGPAILGHGASCVLEAVADALSQGTSFGVPHEAEVRLAEMVCRMVPSVEKLRLVNSGTEATMSCVRLARGFTRRDLIVKFNGCYHGHVDSLLVKAGSGALTCGVPDSAGVPAELAKLTLAIEFNDFEAVQAVFGECGAKIAAVIVEPVPANAGLYLPEPGFLELLRELTLQHGALLIFDEVMTGFRLGPDGAQGRFGVQPDLSAFGKVIGGGLPVGAFGGRAEIMDFLAPCGPVYQAGTLSGNPLAVAAGLAQLSELERERGWERLEEIGAIFEEKMRWALGRCTLSATFHRIGSMFCLYFVDGPVRNLSEARRSDLKHFAQFFHSCLEKGVFFAPSQFEAGFISLAHTREVLEETARVVEGVLAQL